ncbi:MAG: type II toxin-antitoxin system PemK/MazF family toxin [bacterium]
MTSFIFGDIVAINSDVSDADLNGLTQHGVVISAEVINKTLHSVIVCPLIEAETVSQSRIGATFIPKMDTGLKFDAVALSLQIKTIPKERIQKKIGGLPSNYVNQIKESLQAVLDIYP